MSALSVLQLDTRFPRIPGDVACAETFTGDVEIIRISAASVATVVSGQPERIDIRPFEDAIQNARGDVIATSCGFLAYWQDHMQSLTDRPVISSALVALRRLATPPEKTLTITFDAEKLVSGQSEMLGDYLDSVVGLEEKSHLRQVIENDADALDAELAQDEICNLLFRHVTSEIETMVLECTNLPPYKTAMRKVFEGQIIDILSEIEACRPGTVHREFL